MKGSGMRVMRGHQRDACCAKKWRSLLVRAITCLNAFLFISFMSTIFRYHRCLGRLSDTLFTSSRLSSASSLRKHHQTSNLTLFSWRMARNILVMVYACSIFDAQSTYSMQPWIYADRSADNFICTCSLDRSRPNSRLAGSLL